MQPPNKQPRKPRSSNRPRKAQPRIPKSASGPGPYSRYQGPQPQPNTYYSPQQQPPPFYNQPTEAYQQPPQWQQPSYYQPRPPQRSPQQPLLHQRFWHWFRGLSRRMQIIGCSVLILSCVLCSAVAAAAGNNGSQVGRTAIATNTPTQGAVLAATSAPTDTPALQPTATDTPTPTPTATPKPIPTQRPTPTPTPCSNPCNPWGYNFIPGKLIYSPPGSFCNYFSCIPSFWEPDDPDNGYVAQCADGLFSQSGGERGACSGHGGVSRPLYSH